MPIGTKTSLHGYLTMQKISAQLGGGYPRHVYDLHDGFRWLFFLELRVGAVKAVGKSTDQPS
jgi:hypothetical protein